MCPSFQIGLQLWSVRDQCQKDFKGTLEAVAALGYQGVEFIESGGLYHQPAAELAADLKRIGLQTAGIYAKLLHLLEPGHALYEYARALSAPSLTSGDPGAVGSNLNAAVVRFTRAAEIVATSGLTLNYHNHQEEFKRFEGRCALELFLERTAPAKIRLELDTYFTLAAGEDPLAWLRRYAGRMTHLHLKDMHRQECRPAEIGAGRLDVRRAVELALQGGVRWIVVEFHDIPDRPSLESARICIENLKTGMAKQ